MRLLIKANMYTLYLHNSFFVTLNNLSNTTFVNIAGHKAKRLQDAAAVAGPPRGGRRGGARAPRVISAPAQLHAARAPLIPRRDWTTLQLAKEALLV